MTSGNTALEVQHNSLEDAKDNFFNIKSSIEETTDEITTCLTHLTTAYSAKDDVISCVDNINNNYDEPDSKDEKEMIEYEDTLQEFSDGSSVAVDLWFESIFPDDYMRLIQFFATNFIDDIHSGNLGYRNGEIVIIDYCGYSTLLNSKLPKDWYSKYGF